jgi:hypothetical protein
MTCKINEIKQRETKLKNKINQENDLKKSNMINEKNQRKMKLENNFNFINHYK